VGPRFQVGRPIKPVLWRRQDGWRLWRMVGRDRHRWPRDRFT